MPYFASADDVGAHLGRLLQEVVADATAAGPLTRTDVVVRLDLRNPDAEITLDLRGTEGPSVTIGPSELPPHVTLRMESDTAHRFLLGTQNVPVAVARGRIQAEGDAARVVGVLELPRHTAERYAHLLRTAGRADLAAAEDDTLRAVGGVAEAAAAVAVEGDGGGTTVDVEGDGGGTTVDVEGEPAPEADVPASAAPEPAAAPDPGSAPEPQAEVPSAPAPEAAPEGPTDAGEPAPVDAAVTAQDAPPDA